MYEKDYKALDHWWPIIDVRIQGSCRTTLNCKIYKYIYIYNCKKEKLFSKLIYGDHPKKNVEHSSLKNNPSLTKISIMLYP